MIVDEYLTNRDVYSVEIALQKIVRLTTKENYMDIVHYINTHKNATQELDLTMYLNDIACKEYLDLEIIITDKLKTYRDKDAIDDLEKALKKINS